MRRAVSMLAAGVVACGVSGIAPDGAQATTTRLSTKPTHLTRYPVGAAIRWQEVRRVNPAVKRAGRLLRVMYRSESATGAPRAETGVIIVPRGKAPRGGWPVIAWDHGTTGVGPSCAPSRSRALGGYATFLAGVAARGYVVVAPDYEALGLPGEVSPFLELGSEGRSTVDAVRAAHDVVGDLSRRWVVLGHSQGGHAALGTAQTAGTRAPELRFLGTVAMAPASHLADELDTLGSAVPPDTATLPEVAYLLLSAQVSDPRFDPASVVSAGMAAGLDRARTACYDDLYAWYRKHPPAALFTRDWRASEPLRVFASRNDPGTVLSPGPMLLMQGEADTTIAPALTAALDQQLCALGQRVDFRTYPGVEHIPLVEAAAPDAMAWVRARFAGQPASSTCPPD